MRSAKARGRMLASYVSAVIADIRVGGSLAKLNADQINLRFKEMLDAAIGQPSSKPSPIDQSQKAQVLETLPSMRYGAANKAKSKRKPRSLKLSEVLKRYCQEAKVAGKWSDLSAIEIPRGIKFFIRVHGDRPIDTVGRPDVRRYKETLMNLPPNINKYKEYQGKSIKEILAMPSTKAAKKLSPSTINKLLGVLGAFFKYAVHHGHMIANPAEGMQIALRKRQDEYRDAFDIDDLKALFGSQEYRQDGFTRGYQFWTLIIALYTCCQQTRLLACRHLHQWQETEHAGASVGGY